MGEIREYKGEGFVVTYEAEICTHAAECVKGLPGVFEQDRRPWIDASLGSAEAISSVIALCPSGALKFISEGDAPPEVKPEPDATIKTLVDGALRIEGKFTLLNAEGEVLTEKTKVSLCRCGASKNKPFCDGSHREIGFSSEGR